MRGADPTAVHERTHRKNLVGPVLVHEAPRIAVPRLHRRLSPEPRTAGRVWTRPLCRAEKLRSNLVQEILQRFTYNIRLIFSRSSLMKLKNHQYTIVGDELNVNAVLESGTL